MMLELYINHVSVAILDGCDIIGEKFVKACKLGFDVDLVSCETGEIIAHYEGKDA